MAFSDAEQIVSLVGAGAVLCVGGNDPTLGQQLRQRGALVDSVNALAELAAWDEATFAHYDCVVVEASAMLEVGTLASSFAELYRIEPRWVVIRFSEHRDLIRTSREVGRSADWENTAIQAGFRRAPQAVSGQRYFTQCNDPLVPAMLEFERIPPAALAAYPLQQLLAERDLHMDMSREAGARADAHMVRYALAASLVRSGDTVLDCACGLGYGSAILAAQSGGARFIGVDIDAGSAAYASAHFGQQYGIEYVTASATDLSCLADDSIDLVVSFETIEHLEDYQAFLKEAVRVLRPDGRIVASVPNQWVDETGNDPNPHHFHAFDYPKFRATMGQYFLLEERYAQTAPGGFVLQQAARTLYKLALDAPPTETEWLILIGSIDPLAKRSLRAYTDPEFAALKHVPGCWVAQFGLHYDNPWLYRTMVHMGDRLRERAVLTDLAARALGTVQMDSADFGAALTVLGYALLDEPASEHVDDLLPLIDAYLGQDMPNPHAKRWQISSAFLAGRLALGRDARALARMYLTAVEQADFMEFSPLLATKSIAAACLLGAMAMAENDDLAAAAHFANGVQACRKALKADDINAIGDPEAPFPFGFSELAEVADMGAQCAMALKLLPLARRSPGRFWQQVDTKRFGLVSWALALEKENRQLRERLG
ncbi:class I SAM-dependent methyltransferase [Massilia sp. TSP1-1-2]|uniref:class I SAM-dependent methyltransferase n=1 Tax=Massilia sp. TSP1-1-2 TaxID=2804649 RepID=UPI003CF27B83